MTDTKLAPSFVSTRLSIMMFVQFFIWGAWYLTVSLYMMENGMGDVRFYAYTAGPLGAIIAPFITGLIADRFFNTERVLAVLFLLAGAFMLLLPVVGGLEGTATSTSPDGKVLAEEVKWLGMTWDKGSLFNYVILAHMICYMPTLALTAGLSFAHLPTQENFPLIRMWGTIGWIVGGLVLSLFFIKKLADGTEIPGETQSVQFTLGGSAAIVLGLYCFTLPRTPAPKRGQPVNVRDLFFLDAWKEMKNISFLTFIVCSFLVCIPLAAYYASLQQQMYAMEMKNIAIWKNVGTWVEAAMMFMMPFFFRKLGIKLMILIGVAAWVLRYVLFAFGASQDLVSLVMLGILLHGICYDFFFVTGMVYVDKSTSKDIRGQAQGMLVFFTQGLGLFIGAMVTQELAGRAFGDIPSNTPASLEHWPKLWWPMAGMAGVILLIFAVAFHPKKEVDQAAASEGDVAEAAAEESAAP